MIDTLDKKIQDLAKEASELSTVKSGLHQQLKDIDVRLTQIAGAIVEFQKIKTEIQEQGDRDGSQTCDNR